MAGTPLAFTWDGGGRTQWWFRNGCNQAMYFQPILMWSSGELKKFKMQSQSKQMESAPRCRQRLGLGEWSGGEWGGGRGGAHPGHARF